MNSTIAKETVEKLLVVALFILILMPVVTQASASSGTDDKKAPVNAIETTQPAPMTETITDTAAQATEEKNDELSAKESEDSAEEADEATDEVETLTDEIKLDAALENEAKTDIQENDDLALKEKEE